MFAFELKTGRIIFELKSGILAPRRWRQFPLLVGRIGSITIPGTLVPRCSMRHNSIAWHSIWQLENRAADNASKNCFLWRDGQDNQCCVFVRALCVWTYNSEVNPIWALGRCDIADVLWAPWMMKEALVPVSKSLKVRFHLQHFSRRFLSNRWVFRLYPVYTATSSTHTARTGCQKSPSVPYTAMEFVSMSQFWEQLRASRMEHGWAWRVFLRSCFAGWLTSTFSILGKMSLNMIWSLKHGFHHPSPWWRLNSKHVCLCLPVGWFRGQVWLSCLLRMGSGVLSSMVHTVRSPYRCSACTGRVLRWICLSEASCDRWADYNMIKRTQQNKHLPGDKQMKWIELT